MVKLVTIPFHQDSDLLRSAPTSSEAW